MFYCEVNYDNKERSQRYIAKQFIDFKFFIQMFKREIIIQCKLNEKAGVIHDYSLLLATEKC